MNEHKEQETSFILGSGCVIEFNPYHFITQLKGSSGFMGINV